MNRNTYLLLIYATLFSLFVPVWGFSEITLTGKAVDRAEEFPLHGVTVYVREVGFDTVSDSQGLFQVTLDPGTYEIVLVYPGYQRLIITINVQLNGEREFICQLKRDEDYDPSEASVQENRIKHTISRTTLTRREMETIPAGAGDVIRQFIGSIPGVAIPGAGLGVAAFVVRGGEPEDNVIYFDNIPILNVFHFGGLVSIFNSQSIRNIDFYAGGFPPGFGHYSGSVLDLKSTRREKKSFSGKFNANLVTADLFMEGPVGDKFYFMVSARRSYYDFILPRFLPVELDVFPFFWDYFVKLSIDPNQDHQLDLFSIGSSDRMEVSVTRDLADEDVLLGETNFDNNFYSTGLNWKYVASDRWFNEFTLGWLRYNTFVQAGSDPITRDPYYISLKQNRFTLRDSFSFLLRENLELSTGPFITYSYIPIEISAPEFPFDGTRPQGFDELGDRVTTSSLYQSINLNYFAKFTWTLGNFKLIGGPEINWMNLNKYFTVSPRLAFEWNFLDSWMLLGATGIYFQSPTDLELGGYSDLKDKFSVHYIVGLSKQITDTTEAKVEGYFKHGHNLIEYDRTEITRDPVTDEINGLKNIYKNTKQSRAFGVEFFLKQDLWNGFYGWLSYTFSRSLYKESTYDDYALSRYDQTHMFTLVFSYAIREWLQVSGKWRLASGQPYTSVVGRQRVFPQEDFESTYEPVYNGSPFNARYPFQHQLDIRFDFRFSALGGNWGIYLEAINVYNAQNVISYDYGDEYENIDKPDARTSLPILPYIGIEYEF
jgi:hypothetical protein